MYYPRMPGNSTCAPGEKWAQHRRHMAPGAREAAFAGAARLRCPVTTLGAFLEDQGLRRIDLLKVPQFAAGTGWLLTGTSCMPCACPAGRAGKLLGFVGCPVVERPLSCQPPRPTARRMQPGRRWMWRELSWVCCMAWMRPRGLRLVRCALRCTTWTGGQRPCCACCSSTVTRPSWRHPVACQVAPWFMPGGIRAARAEER
jgi:hypothetical protein